MKNYYMVGYDYLAADYGIPKQRLMVAENQTFEEMLDYYFSDFFGENTVKEDKKIWRANDWEQVIKVTSWTEVPEEDALIIKKYLF